MGRKRHPKLDGKNNTHPKLDPKLDGENNTPDNESDEELELRDAFKILCKKAVDLKRANLAFEDKVLAHEKCEDKLNAEINELSNKMFEYESEICESISEIKKLQETITSLSEENEQFKSHNASLKRELEKAKFIEVEKNPFVENNRLLEIEKSEILISAEKSKLEYEEKFKSFEKQISELTQQLESALIVKVGLENSSKKLENMLSSQKSGTNKEGLGFLHLDPKPNTKPVFVKATNQNSSFNGASSSKSKTFIDRTPKVPRKPNLKTNFQHGNKFFGKNIFEKKGDKNNFVKNDRLDFAFENNKHTLPQPFWCDFCGHKGHLKEFCWQALKGKPRHEKGKHRYIKAKAPSKVVNLNPRLFQRKVYPQPYFCTYCRKEGHLREYCYKLGKSKCATYESSSNLEKHMQYLVSKVFQRMLTYQTRYKKRTKKNRNTPNTSIRQSKPRQVWVRKDELKCCVVETRNMVSPDLPSPIPCIETSTKSLDNQSLGVCLAF